MEGKDAKRTPILRYLGAVMVSAALMTLWFVTTHQQSQIERMQQQIEHLDTGDR